ncbi:MAG: family 43 glycosylhydrolase [Opitutaceae bacterium]|nr:family 43 glycosylhydrolase [Opitutaceae bacterium]
MKRSSLLLVAFTCLASVVGAANTGTFQNPVRAGDYPDPSVIAVGGGYWATATSSEWAPHFPLLHSRDLVNWEVRGYVFNEAPAWAKGSFWAPEIAEDRGTFFIYYTARRHDGRLAVAVATAKNPGGPYTDHGELVSQAAGSIDAVPFTDAKGVRWMIWKEDGNSRKQPTPLWIQRLRDDGLALVGERREIMRNDPASWEGAVIEGPFVLRRGEWYYLFYSGNACCGRGCNYKLGIARAKDPLGPWEKCPANPLLGDNETWRCPGHGSLVGGPGGRTWLLYHAYAAKGFVATGREMLLDEVVFGPDGWPSINGGKGPSTRAKAPVSNVEQKMNASIRDEFSGGQLAPGWQWPVSRRPDARMQAGFLTLRAGAAPAAAVQSITVPSFVAETSVDIRKLGQGAFAGLSVYGDSANQLALVTDGTTIEVWNQRRGERAVAAKATAAAVQMLRLRVACTDGQRFRFAVQDSGGQWTEIAGETDGSFLPPWDRAVRVGVFISGPTGAEATFDYFAATPGDGGLFAR